MEVSEIDLQRYQLSFPWRAAVFHHHKILRQPLRPDIHRCLISIVLDIPDLAANPAGSVLSFRVCILILPLPLTQSCPDQPQMLRTDSDGIGGIRVLIYNLRPPFLRQIDARCSDHQ